MKITKRAAFIWLTAFFCLGAAIGSVVARPGFIFIGLLVIAVIAFIFIPKQKKAVNQIKAALFVIFIVNFEI